MASLDPSALSKGPSFHGLPSNIERALYAAITVAERVFGLTLTATRNGQHVSDSYHYRGEAIDVSGSPKAMDAFAKWAEGAYGDQILELIHNGGPGNDYAVKNGQKVNGAVVYSSVWAQHRDHVHLALKPGAKVNGGGGLSGVINSIANATGFGAAESAYQGVKGTVDSAGQLLDAVGWVFSAKGLLTIVLVLGGAGMAYTGLARATGVRAPVRAATAIGAAAL